MSLSSNVAPDPHGRPDIPTGYAIVPHSVARDASLSAQARLLFVIIDGHCGSKSTQKLRLATLASELGASVSTVRRYLRELEDAGLVRTYRTGRALIVGRDNPARKRATGERSDASPVNTRKRSNKRELTTTSRPSENVTPPASPVTVAAGEYLKEINHATGALIQPNQTVTAHLGAIAEQGRSPAELATLVAAELAANRGHVRNPGGFIVGIILPSIAAGASLTEPEPMTYLPPSPLDLHLAEQAACHHGTPGGASKCGLCRHATVGTAA